MGSARIKGTGLIVRLASTVPDGYGTRLEPVDHFADCVSVVLDHSGTVQSNAMGAPIVEAATWFFDVTAVQSTDPASLWSLLWSHEYERAPFVYAPHGNPVPTEAQPHFTGTLSLGRAPALGGAAGASVEYVFTTRFTCVGKPLRVDAPTP